MQSDFRCSVRQWNAINAMKKWKQIILTDENHVMKYNSIHKNHQFSNFRNTSSLVLPAYVKRNIKSNVFIKFFEGKIAVKLLG